MDGKVANQASGLMSPDGKGQKRLGKVIHKGHGSYNLMLDLQVGWGGEGEGAGRPRSVGGGGGAVGAVVLIYGSSWT